MENRIIHAFVYALSGAVFGLILIPVRGLGRGTLPQGRRRLKACHGGNEAI